ncbi:MAG TPA: zinc ribbon domain-containing protein [Candidatus Binataceae bacterium]|nr:zinc ribbon domain-containing protein [Candidatus Binataceae bacterium]
MYQTIFGIAMAVITALALWWKARHHYRCPLCGQFVQWKDVNCPHCGNDMNYRHRAGPDALPRAAADLRRGERTHRR